MGVERKPFLAKQRSQPASNQRPGETVHKLWSFREAFKSRRCLIPTSGFFELKKEASGGKTPMWFHREDQAHIAFAGIWSREVRPGGPVEV